jgi:hypothetical protein
MRLTIEQRCELHAGLRHRFGVSARMWLFGSRAGDTVRHAAFDFLLQKDDSNGACLIEAKLDFLGKPHSTPALDGDRVDLALHSLASNPRSRPSHPASLAECIEIT